MTSLPTQASDVYGGSNGGETWQRNKDAAISSIHHQQSQIKAAPFHQTGQDKHSWDVRKILHLYMYEYCLKQNHIKAANAIANDTGLRTDEGVPFAVESIEGLLLDWFTAFWSNLTSSPLAASQGQSGLRSHQQLQREYQHQSPMSSNIMRRNETEPIKRSPAIAEFPSNSFNQISNGSQGVSGVPYSIEIKTATPVIQQHMGPGKTSPDIAAAAAMQKMGWADRTIDNLSGDERSKLVSFLERSQLAQHQALQRMAVTHQNTSLETSANRGFNGSVFQQKPFSMKNALQQQQQQQVQSNSGNLQSPSQQMTESKRRTARNPAVQRKKRRSSVNIGALTQIQQLQPQHSALKKEHIANTSASLLSALEMGLAPSPSIASNAKAISLAEESLDLRDHHSLAGRQQMQRNENSKQQLQSTPMSISWSSGASSSSNNQNNVIANAQSQVASHISTQLGAQIAQMQNQLNRQNSSSEGISKLNSNQISQLKALQGKLNQQVNGVDSKQQHQQQVRSYSDMGPPPTSKGGLSNPPTPVMTTSNSLSSSQTTPDWARSSSGLPSTSSFDHHDMLKHQQILSTTESQHFHPASRAFDDADFTNFDWSSLEA